MADDKPATWITCHAVRLKNAYMKTTAAVDGFDLQITRDVDLILS